MRQRLHLEDSWGSVGLGGVSPQRVFHCPPHCPLFSRAINEWLCNTFRQPTPVWTSPRLHSASSWQLQPLPLYGDFRHYSWCCALIIHFFIFFYYYFNITGVVCLLIDHFTLFYLLLEVGLSIAHFYIPLFFINHSYIYKVFVTLVRRLFSWNYSLLYRGQCCQSKYGVLYATSGVSDASSATGDARQVALRKESPWRRPVKGREKFHCNIAFRFAAVGVLAGNKHSERGEKRTTNMRVERDGKRI